MNDIAHKLEQARELFVAGRIDEARTRLQRLAQQAPRDPGVATALATVLMMKGEHEQSLFHARRAAAILPDDPMVMVTVANSLALLKKTDEALMLFERAAALAPERPEPRQGLANILRDRGKLRDAEMHLRAALVHSPGDQTLESLLGATLWSMAKVPECIAVCRESLARNPGHAPTQSLLANALNYFDGAEPEEILAAHHAYGRTLAADTPSVPELKNTREPDRPLHVGILSADLRRHSVAYFLRPLIEHMRGPLTRITCYSTADPEDADSAKFKSMADAWRPVAKLSAEQLAERIRADRVDILIETSGLTFGHRMGVLARRCAPVQVTYCGYPNTTGVPNVDWRIVDELTDPAGAERWCTEQLCRLKPCFLCYHPPEDAPPVVPRSGSTEIAFGSFNAAAKLNPRVFALWARVLQATPGSTLMLKSIDFREPQLRADITSSIAAYGVDPARIRILEPTQGLVEHLGLYSQMDVALDTLPYNGTTTTLEALHMGLPVVTLPGHTHAGRVGISLLSALELKDLIATDEDDYVRIATELAADRARRESLRATLRSRLAGSVLCDGRAFAARFQDALRSMWRAWCSQGR